jgi:glycosyltransferase involved in cell wall biosynthesis
VFIKIKDQWNGYLVFAGAPLDGEMASLIAQYDISSRVIQVAGFSASTLEALYNGAFALVYLSRFEGFGLPIIEAQACGCPVLCSSDCGPFPEIVGDSAVLRPSKDIDGFAEAILRLEGLSERESLIKKGFQNVEKFSAQRMVNDYARLYREILEEK